MGRRDGHRRRTHIRVLVAVACAALTMATCTPATTAAVTWESTVEAPITVRDLECPASNSCYGIDAIEGGVYHWDGRVWSRLPIDAPVDELWHVRSLSCPAADVCYVAGSHRPRAGGDGDARTLVVRWDGRELVRLPTDPDLRAGAANLACASVRWCMVLQTALDGPYVLVWDGESFSSFWGPPGGLASPLTCLTETMCMHGFSRWNGSAWTYPPEPPKDASLTGYYVRSAASDLDCPTPSFCIAIGRAERTVPTPQVPMGELVEERATVTFWNGRTWSPLTLLRAPGLPEARFNDFTAVGCSSPRWCVVYGHTWGTQRYEASFDAKQPWALVWDGARWALAPPAPNPQLGSNIDPACVPGEHWCLVHSYSTEGPLPLPKVPAAIIRQASRSGG